MQIIHTVSALQSALHLQTRVALVPTMGNLHAGHMHLVNVAKQQASCVVVSIFVNPLQFGANEDLASYPRTLQADCAQLEMAGADIVFAPSVAEMYGEAEGERLNQQVTIDPPAIANMLCGASRPGHFAGVATVVAKLFNIVQPQVAIFGQKDFQQLFIIRALVKQLNYPIEVMAADTIRETSGLAMSSRNGYLTIAQKNQAAQLNQALHQVGHAIKNGACDYPALEQNATQQLTAQGWLVDYISIRCSNSLLPAQPQDKQLVILAAAKLGNTRLIDNIELTI